ncbi:SoxR reducing system RseC family protein [uncultured Bacteroides sp.]|uniref:SoxR reducing system RseC family protein n=1 Tax=uncultured Bacteroides sp. TaxID=162156 RepID=UPI002625BC8A|nr:SoxR reducing system RseC family protein [uncultured Bacteroides sp.]
MNNNIKHLGIVESIDGSHVRVKILQSSACSSCSVKGHCNISETKEKIIDIHDKESAECCSVGQQVMVCGTTSMGMKAVFLAFVLPFVVLLASLFVTMRVTDGDEATSALVSLCTLIPYYIIIYLLRNKISRTFSFTLETINN